MSEYNPLGVKVKILKLHSDATIPKYETEGASGFDLASLEEVHVNPFETVAVRTGLAVEVPIGFEIQVRPRSGVSLRTKIRVANSPGTIDSDFRGEVKVIIENNSSIVFQISKGMKIAQGVLCPVFYAEWEVSENLSETGRGEGGFGSTDK